jgi:hypothetical protein
MPRPAKRLARMPAGRYEPECNIEVTTISGHVPVVYDPGFSITEACADALIVRQASNTGGLGAEPAPNGEREGHYLRAAPGIA